MSEAPKRLPTSISLAIIFAALVAFAIALGLFLYFCKVAIHEALGFLIGPS